MGMLYVTCKKCAYEMPSGIYVEGEMPMLKENEHKCPQCGSIFKYDQKDYHEELKRDKKLEWGLAFPYGMRDEYGNGVLITHSPIEFRFLFYDTAYRMDDSKAPTKGVVKSQIIMNPIIAKNFLRAFKENIEKYEGKFGEIKELDIKEEEKEKKKTKK